MAGKQRSLSDVMPKVARKVSAETPTGDILDDIALHGISTAPDPRTRARSRGAPIAKRKPTSPNKAGQQLFKRDSSKFTIAEILAGKHLRPS